MRTTVQILDQALNAEDELAAQAHKRELERDTDVLLQTAGATLGLVGGIQEAIGVNDDENVAEEAAELLTRIEAQSNELSARDSVASGTETQQEQVRRLGDDLTELENLLAEFQHIDADILVQPFRSKVNSVGTAALQPSDYFAPTVIALLLQHLAVTFGALSIVREHREGTMELFSVAPISAIETLLSKYLSYLLFSGILAVILTLAIIFGLQVPMLGSWLNYSLTLAALIFTSLGYGFVISMMAKTDTEAVQYSMIVLLMSVFFSGAFVNLNLLWEPVRLVSWLIPATYAIQLLQDIMLRGYLVNLILLSVLALVGLVMFGLAWGRLRGAMAQI
jgi:ABC-2 type transport system permease protein